MCAPILLEVYLLKQSGISRIANLQILKGKKTNANELRRPNLMSRICKEIYVKLTAIPAFMTTRNLNALSATPVQKKTQDGSGLDRRDGRNARNTALVSDKIKQRTRDAQLARNNCIDRLMNGH